AATVRAWFVLKNGGGLVFDDSRTLGRMELLGPDEVAALHRELGVEPLSREFTPELFVSAARATRRPAKLYLMDQNHIAGLGNIYAAEALHTARVHPAKPMNRLSRKKLVALHAAIVGILRNAVKSACNAYSGPGRFESGETFHLAVYGREGEACYGCGRLIRRITQGGRSTYYCPGCQR
ncbi:MAG: DNA-formamidopyrimidine glycosylase, partial [bacterium]|nr:DNA-formamidopyrimidine glycosylase [bacterium]